MLDVMQVRVHLFVPRYRFCACYYSSIIFRSDVQKSLNRYLGVLEGPSLIKVVKAL